MTLTIRMNLRRLKRKKLSVALSSFIMAWAMAMIVAGLFSSHVLDISASTYLEGIGMPDLFVSLSDGVPSEDVDDALSPIGSYDARLVLGGRTTIDGVNRSITLIGIQDPNTDINRLILLNGTLFSAYDECVVVVGGDQQEGRLVVTVNGTVLDLDVTGTVRTAEYQLNDLEAGSIVSGEGSETVAYLPLSTLQSVVGPVVNDALLMIDDNISREESDAALAALPVSSVVYSEDHSTTIVIRMGVDKLAVMTPSISMVFFLIGAVSIFITMYKLVQSDSRSIGILMSLGMDRGRIATAYLAMAMVILVIGGGLGVLFGYGFTATISQLALDMMGDIPVILSFDPVPFLLGLCVTAVVVVGATMVPVALLIRRSVNESLRYVPRTRVWVRGRSTGSLAVASGVRNLMREPRRAAVVLMAVGLSIGAAGSWLIMVDSMETYFQDQMSSAKWDVELSFNSPMNITQVMTDYYTGDVSSLVPYVAYTGTVSSDNAITGGRVIVATDIGDVRTFDLRDGELDFEGAVIVKNLADDLGIEPGDMIAFSVGGMTASLLVTGEIDDLGSNTIYTGNASLMNSLGNGSCQGAYVFLRDPGNADGYVGSLMDDTDLGEVTTSADSLISMNDLFQGSLSMFYGFFAINLSIALAVAVLATIISTSERDMEFATIASLGLPRSFVLRSLAAEVGVQALVSAILAVPFSLILAQTFALLLEDAVFYIPIGLTLSSAVTVVMVGWLFICPSVAWPIRWVRRLDIARILRERSSG